ncbi:MAG: DNA mismatch repair endonuclease MutL [Bacteroidota bacterium]
MSDIIQLLPDSVANQIAAGEVIQRPASAVKELLENAIDAGSSRIKLILKDAGKTLIQITDDGTGMSDLDARLCFERHATSKIRSVDDLFTLHTMGFRGEALASIAAIAQVELKTKRSQDETGTQVIIEGSEVISQEPYAGNTGTSFSIKNLFYNVPARRNFLKSNAVETRHIIEEFTRVALAHPSLAFTLIHNDATIFDLRAGNFRQRISSVFGNIYNERLVPVEEDTTIVKIQGYVGKPEFSKKVRGEQYFFVNNRFIKDAYLHHAVNAAFENMIPRDCYPTYFLKIDINPAHIDVNIHPTKTEIKFEDEKSVYAIVRASVKRALGKFSVAPAIDFEQERSFDIPLEKMNQRPVPPSIQLTPGYNPFNSTEKKAVHRNDVVMPENRNAIDRWSELNREINTELPQATMMSVPSFAPETLPESSFVQVYRQYIFVNAQPAMMFIDQQRAHERILFEKYTLSLSKNIPVTQQQLFPQPLEFTANEAVVLNELLPQLRTFGFDITAFGTNTFVVHGAPEEVNVGSERKLLTDILDQFMHSRDTLKVNSREQLALSLARQLAVKAGQVLSPKEMKELINNLFHCEHPYLTPGGKPVALSLSAEKLIRLFGEMEQGRIYNQNNAVKQF